MLQVAYVSSCMYTQSRKDQFTFISGPDVPLITEVCHVPGRKNRLAMAYRASCLTPTLVTTHCQAVNTWHRLTCTHF